MRTVHPIAVASSIAALLVVASCDSGTGTGPAGGASGESTAGGEGGSAWSGGASSGATSGGASSGATSGGANDGGASNGGASNEGGSSGSPGGAGASGAEADGPDAGDAAGATEDAGVIGAEDGEPCPNGDECGAGLVCVGYGNPLPNGESTACRRTCTAEAPPPNCTCVGGGFCEDSGGGGTGGTSGAPDGGGNCGGVIVNAGCADADATTTDFQSGEFQGCLHWRDLGDGAGWIHYETFGGFHYDLQTSLGWVNRTTSGTMTLAQAADFCASFSVVGLSDWRLPTIDEARSLAGGCAATAPDGTCALSDPSCLDSSCGAGTDCTSCLSGDGPHVPDDRYCRAEVMLCTSFHTTSLCPDCGTPSDWRYGAINGNFVAGSVDQALFPVCVMENIPNAVPCRN